MDAEEALDRIGKIVGWGSNPAPADPEDALGEVMRVLNRYVAGSSTAGTATPGGANGYAASASTTAGNGVARNTEQVKD